jgi:hypothetical protein
MSMEPRESIAFRFERRKADAVADPTALTGTMSGRLDTFGKFEKTVRAGLELVAEIRKIRAQNPHGFSQGEAKDLWSQLLTLEPIMPHVRLLVSHNFFLWFRDSWELSLSILQQFVLPTPLRRKIEQTSKYWATKQRPKTKRDKSNTMEDRYAFVFELYLEQLKTLREQQAAFTEALAKGKPMSQADEAKVKAGPFTLVNTGGFNEDAMNAAATVVEKAGRILQQKGFGKICYGDVNITKQIGRGKVLAFYLKDSDEFFVRAGVRLNVDTLHTVLHEFGHRMHRKFLQGNDALIKRLYGKYKTKAMFRLEEGPIDESKLPKVGEEVPYKGDILVVTEIDYLKRKIRMKSKANPDSRATYSTGFNDFNIVFKGETEKAVKPTGFITQYAGKSPEEMFAEMFAYYCTDELSAAQLEDFAPLIA